MAYNAKEFLDTVVRPALLALDKNSIVAQQLILGTAIQESLLTYTRQMGSGPALGYFQMEPKTHDDIWKNYLAYKSELAGKVRGLANIVGKGTPSAALLETNHLYAAAMARAHYARKKPAFPAAGDVEGLAKYWKEHYNTYKGKGKTDEFVTKWKTFGAGNLDWN